MKRPQNRRPFVTIWTSILSVFFLSACAAIESVDESLNYVNDATGYIQQVSEAGTELQQMAQDAVNNADITAQFKDKLEQLQTKANEFKQIHPPAIAETIHEKLLSYNDQLITAVTNFNESLAAQGFSLENWQRTGIPDLIANINNLKQQLGELGGG
ncbi:MULTISPECIES: DUF6376 family protein [Paenibacillus]|uniref:DUF6376 family protein n=1 Tax=Paenibacillus TaxID=44249 RepID=UPI002FE24395